MLPNLPNRCRHRLSWVAVIALVATVLSTVLGADQAAAQNVASSMRADVRRLPSAAPSGDPSSDCTSGRKKSRPDYYDDISGTGDSYDDDSFGLFMWLLMLSSPAWAPHAALGDSYDIDGYFAPYPYQGGVRGYMGLSDNPWDAVPALSDANSGLEKSLNDFRRWSARFRGEYLHQSADLRRIGGHLLVETTSRWGIDTEMSYLKETLADGTDDTLWLGDCNLTLRFAQSETMQWRAGLGFNWLDDPHQTDFGFNFTYGVDWFPVRPWVVSAELDWGSLGSAELFRFRSTAGVLILGLETYIGYEHLDIDRTQTNSLIGGLRLWF